MRRGISVVAAVALAAGTVVAATAPSAHADTTASVALLCVAHAPIIGDQFASDAINVSTAAPATVAPGQTFAITTTFPAGAIAPNQSGGTVSSVRDLAYKLPVPANSTFVSATLSGGSNYGGSATATLQGSATTGFVRYSVPGPITAGQTFQVPALTLTLTAGSIPFGTIQPRLGGTSYTDPGFETSAVITSPISATVATDCYPGAPNPAWSTTTIVPPDTAPPVITLATPVQGGQYPLGGSVPVNYSCDDGAYGSGVATCAGDLPNGASLDTSTLGTYSFTVTSTDNLGHAATPVTHTYSVVPAGNDAEPPTIAITTPSNGSVYAPGAAVTASYACADTGSGVASCSGPVANGAAINTATVGTHTFTVTTVDNEGNPHAALTSYRVQAGAVQQNWTSGDVTNRMPVGCDSFFSQFHESIPTSSNTAPTTAAASSQFEWRMTIADDVIPTLNNGTNLLYRWKKPTNGHFVSASFTGVGSNVNGTAIAINPDGTLKLTIASVTDQSILGFGDDHFNPPPFKAVIQVDGPPGTVVQNQFDYFELTTSFGGVSHCPAGDPTFNGRVNTVLTNTSVVDSTPPIVAVTSPVHGATYPPGADLRLQYSCADNFGIPSCTGTVANGAALDTSTSGVFQASVTSVDAAGNTSKTWVTYRIANPKITVTDATVTEGPGTQLDFAVTLSNPSNRTVSLDYATADGTAIAPGDYAAASGSMSFAPGDPLTKHVVVSVTDDDMFTGNKALTLALSNAVNGTITDGIATGSIIDSDPPGLTVTDASVTEGPGATLDFAVTLAADPAVPTSVAYTTVDGSATAPGRYGAASGTLLFSPGGALTQHVVINVVNDAIYNAGGSPVRTQTMSLSASTATETVSGTGTITDDEPQPLTANIGSASLHEGDAYNRAVKLAVSLNRAPTVPVRIGYTTVAGTATAPADFKAKTGTLVFNPGQVVKPIAIPLVGDTINEGAHGFTVELTSATNAVVGNGIGEVAIVDDDAPTAAIAQATVSDVSVYEGPAGKKLAMTFLVTLSTRPAGTVTIKYKTIAGTATGADLVGKTGTLTFKPTQVSKPVTIQVIGDAVVEGDEAFTLVLSDPTGPVNILDGTGTGTIKADD